MSKFRPPLPTFVIAEDNLMDFQLIQDAIQATEAKHPIIHVENGMDLLDYLKRWSPDQHEIAAIFMDLKMPILNGLETLEVLKEQDSTRNIPVIMVTASNYSTDIEKAYELGVNGYMIKAMSIQEFNESIHYLVGYWGKINQRPMVNSYQL